MITVGKNLAWLWRPPRSAGEDHNANQALGPTASACGLGCNGEPCRCIAR